MERKHCTCDRRHKYFILSLVSLSVVPLVITCVCLSVCPTVWFATSRSRVASKRDYWRKTVARARDKGKPKPVSEQVRWNSMIWVYWCICVWWPCTYDIYMWQQGIFFRVNVCVPCTSMCVCVCVHVCVRYACVVHHSMHYEIPMCVLRMLYHVHVCIVPICIYDWIVSVYAHVHIISVCVYVHMSGFDENRRVDGGLAKPYAR